LVTTQLNHRIMTPVALVTWKIRRRKANFNSSNTSG